MDMLMSVSVIRRAPPYSLRQIILLCGDGAIFLGLAPAGYRCLSSGWRRPSRASPAIFAASDSFAQVPPQYYWENAEIPG
ncbi:MAG: hypothetical protein BroJett003_06450 [Planctomycetota bacterium]|nr:MAG: hypothetical protein BroJett003_06450 [Planctomycetota bacterium]